MNNINQTNTTTKNPEIFGINNIIENCLLNIYQYSYTKQKHAKQDNTTTHIF